MNFTITINGEGPELGKALKQLREVMDGHQIGDGSVTASITPVTPAPTATPQHAAQAYQQQQAYTPPAPVPTAVPTQPAPGAVPTTTPPAYTMEQLGVAATPLVDAGRGPELSAWLSQRGAAALSQLDPAFYGDFATHLRSLGAKI